MYLTHTQLEVGCIEPRNRLALLNSSAQIYRDVRHSSGDFEPEDYVLISRQGACDNHQLINRLFPCNDCFDLSNRCGGAVAPAFAIGNRRSWSAAARGKKKA